MKMPSTDTSRLLLEERRREMLNLIESQGRATIAELVKRFDVSAVTARADLDALAKMGAIVRSHGGAVRCEEPVRDYPVSYKAELHRTEKSRIGRAAAQLVQPNETVILDSGTTTWEIARQLKALKLPGVTVITNALNIAVELADEPAISVIMLGGILRHISSSFVGPQAEAMLREMHADRLFLAVDGFDIDIGPTTPDILEAQLNTRMMDVTKETTVVADSSKLGRRSVSRIGTMSQIRRLITDTDAPPEFVQSLRTKGVEILQV